MFCHVFRFSERTGLQLSDYEQCTDSCKHCTGKNICAISEQKMENLTKEKYNWVIETTIQFDEPKVSKSGNTKYLNATCLIHPSHNDMWVVNAIRHSKVDDSWTPEYRMYFGTDMKEFPTLAALNSFLRKNGYEGRKLVESDFIKSKIKEE